MRDAQQSVRAFMLAVGQNAPSKPEVPDLEVQSLRVKLHHEEAVTELDEAFNEKNIYKIADSLADSLVVILGTAVACGIDIQPIFEEVMRSNMTKVIDGHKRDDGKWMKGPSYEPPQLAPLVDHQLVTPFHCHKCAGTFADHESIYQFRGHDYHRGCRPV